MKIDLHCHTIEIKDGESNRNVDKDTFKKKILLANVKMVAITNHNSFDLSQLELFSDELTEKSVLLLPGIELNVTSDKSGKLKTGHVIIVSTYDERNKFDDIVKSLKIADPNNFLVDIDNMIEAFKSLQYVFYAMHYKKNPSFTLDDYLYLKSKVNNKTAVVLEPSNARKAGIIINDGCTSWFGSDVTDWDNYEKYVLPDSIFELNKLEQLISLLQDSQDAALLNSCLDKKYNTKIQIQPYADLSLQLKVFNSTNIIFGEKATGKTDILKAIEEEFKKIGIKTRTFYIENKNDSLLSEIDTKPNDAELLKLDTFSCNKEIQQIKNWSWNVIPTIKDFYNWKSTSSKNDILKRLKIVESAFNEKINDDTFDKILEDMNAKLDCVECAKDINNLSTENDEEKEIILESLNLLSNNIRQKQIIDWKINKILALQKFTIDTIKSKFAKKEGTTIKPNNVGLFEMLQNLLVIKKATETICKNIDYVAKSNYTLVGYLPERKSIEKYIIYGFGKLPKSKHKDWVTEKFLNASCTKSLYNDFLRKMNELKENVFCTDILKYAINLKKFIIEHSIDSLKYFLRYTVRLKNGKEEDFKPSNGETTMLLVNAALSDKTSKVVILDEPDGGMGSSYVNGVLLTLIRDKIQQGDSAIFIATHDPSLIVRTHPYQCIYRELRDDGYQTFIGSYFESFMINYNNVIDKVSWGEKVIEKCEGGNDSLDERERAYYEHRTKN